MDQPGLDPRRHHAALDALGRANAISRTAASLWPVIADAAKASSPQGFRVLDIACGGGHVLVSLARRAARARLDVDWLGWDVNAVAVDHARTVAARAGVKQVRFERADALREPLPADADLIACTLFLHHLAEPDAIALLGRLRLAARRAVVVSDLRRTWLGGVFTRLAGHALSRSDVFRVDGMRSIAAAFTTEEASALAARAGLTGARVCNIWPQRWLLRWARDEGLDAR